MAKRPTHIDISPSAVLDPMSRPLFTPHGNVVSPSNDVPPALSPLDAFAMQGRLLQKKFEEQSLAGRRLSRLPHMTIASEFAKARPGYFRSMTTGSQTLGPQQHGIIEEEYSLGNTTEIHSAPRPKSHYPQMFQPDGTASGYGRGPHYQTPLHRVREVDHDEPRDKLDYWTLPRSQSPEEYDTTPLADPNVKGMNAGPSLTPTTSSLLGVSPPKFTAVPSSAGSRSLGTSPSIRPVLSDVTDDLSHMSLGSNGSASVDKPNPPFQNQFARSPSLASDKSFNSNLARPSYNYSRPMSRQSRPSTEFKAAGEGPYRQLSGAKSGPRPLDFVYRQDSTETPLTPFTNDTPQTPVSMASEELFFTPEHQHESTPTSFVYKKYNLGPRTKRDSKRVSVGLEEFMNRQFTWEDPKAASALDLSLNSPFFLAQAPPSPALTGSPPGSGRFKGQAEYMGSPRTSAERARKRLQKARPATRPTTPATTYSTTHTVSSNASTIKPTTDSAKSTLAGNRSAEEHLDRGIELHEAGSLQESTYHLRLAAKAGHPTAQVLYALACRHGWGMKPNAAEGVMWLQTAVNSAQLEVAEDENMIKNGQRLDFHERKTHKAQFALGVYELGRSYMNGWGVAQDKSLGLRCFEIAGNWGDADALAEAGLCYMEGIGCKKDMKKSAKLYRLAETKGVTVAGNSWIHKEKYLETDSDNERPARPRRKGTSESKKREKSRARALFGRKKSTAS